MGNGKKFIRKTNEKKEEKPHMQGEALKFRPYQMNYVEALHNIGYYTIYELCSGDKRIIEMIISKVKEGEINCRHCKNVNAFTFLYLLDYLDWMDSKKV